MICPDCNGRGESICYVETYRDENTTIVEQRKGICRACNGSGKKPQTNADRIRAMSDAELVDRIHQLNTLNAEGGDFSLLFCDGKANCIDSDGNVHCCEEREKACILRWLRQVAEE